MSSDSMLFALLRVSFLRNLLGVALLVSFAFPLYERYIGYPHFERLLVSFVEQEGARVTRHLSTPLRALPNGISRTTLPASFAADADTVMHDFQIEELNVYGPDGEVVYATDDDEIGTRNDRPYFRDIVAKGHTFTQVVRKEGATMEGRIETRDVVESYIPLMQGSSFLGAFEIYYDMTAERAAMDGLLTESALRLVGMGVLLLLVVLTVLMRTAVAMRERENAQVDLHLSEIRYRNIAASAQDAMIEMDHTGCVSLWNRAAERIFGYSAAEALGQDLHRLIVPQRFLKSAEGGLAHFQATGDGPLVGRTMELVGVRRDGTEIPVEVSIAAIEGKGGPHALGILRDISERKESEQRLKLGSSVIEHARHGITITNAQTQIQLVNPAFTRVTGYAAEEVIGHTPSILKSGRHGAEFYHTLWQTVAEKGEWEGEIWNRRKNGEIYPEWLSISAVRDNQGRVTHFVGIFSDITPIKDWERGLERLAFYDPLTGIPNRMLFHERLNQAFKEARRDGGEHIAVLYIDLDWFKQINDTHGHEIGDLLLQETAQRLTKQVREIDTVARLGGDEFAIVLRRISDATLASAIATKVVSVLAIPFQLRDIPCHIAASLGVALYPDHAANPQDLIAAADAAMYEAKRGGRNQYRLAEAPPTENALISPLSC